MQPMSSKVRIALIDADGYCYNAACRSELKVSDGEGGYVFLPSRTPEAAYEELVTAIEKAVSACGADQVFVCLTHGENFRKGVLPSYKENRKDNRRPAFLTDLRNRLNESEYRVLTIKGLEADDVLGITAGALQRAGREPVMVSEDKDLKTIPGLLYAKGELQTITEEDADFWHLYQTLTGDAVDGYVGCPGIGPVGARLALEMTPRDRWWDVVVSCYEVAGLTEEDALTQARCARILRFQDWDADKGEAILWEPPKAAAEETLAA